MTDFLQLVIYGIVYGSIISLGAIGISLTFGILRFANFAHGDMMTVGAYFAFTFLVVLQLPWIIAFPVAAACTALVAVLADQIIYKRLRRASPMVLLVSAFGIAIILRSLVQLFWGPRPQVFEAGIQLPFVFAGFRIKPDQLYILGFAIALVIALHFFLQHTRIGTAMRAMADNVDLSRITGIDTERVVFWTWVIGGVLAAAAGVFIGVDTRVYPDMGWRMLLPIFAAAILGGIGKPYGAIVGGYVVGISEEVPTLFMVPTYKAAVSFAILVLMLIFRPTGLFGGR
jgi:branched-chain amino acid transport system permease protein/neutral amino acid transport system permease protein